MEIQRIVRITPKVRNTATLRERQAGTVKIEDKSIFSRPFTAPLLGFFPSNENGIPVVVALIEMSSGEVVEVNLQYNKVEFTGAAQAAGSSLFSTTTRLEFNHKNLGWDIVIGDNNVI